MEAIKKGVDANEALESANVVTTVSWDSAAKYIDPASGIRERRNWTMALFESYERRIDENQCRPVCSTESPVVEECREICKAARL